MAARSSSTVVGTALGLNVLITVAKFAGAAFTGSSAMLSEAIHSLVDASSQVLLLHGMRRSLRPPDERFPFGYGRELYFWSFIVAILLFAMGAGVSIYEGVQKLSTPQPMHQPQVNYSVLGIALAMQIGSMFLALRHFNRGRGRQSLIAIVRASKNSAVFIVLVEAIASTVGVVTAFIGIALSQFAGVIAADGAAALVIGLIMAAVASFLSVEIKSLLIGEAARKTVPIGIAKLLEKHDGADGPIDVVNEIKTMQLGPDDVLVAVSIDVKDSASAADVEHLTSRLKSAVRLRFPEVKHFFLEVQAADKHKAYSNELARTYEQPDPLNAGGTPTSTAPLVVEALRALDQTPSTPSSEPATAAASSRPIPRPPTHPHGTRKRSKGHRRKH